MSLLAVTDQGRLYCPLRCGTKKPVIDCDRNHLPQSYALEDLLELNAADLEGVTHGDILGQALHALLISDTARLLINEAAERGWAFTLSSDDTDVFIDDEHATAIIPLGAVSLSVYARQSFRHVPLMAMMIKALRLIWQTETPEPLVPLIPSALLLKKRILAADVACVSLIIAWELREMQDAQLWRHIMSGDCNDLALLLTDEMEAGMYDQVSDALPALFAEWFWDDERLQHHDRIALDDLDVGMAANDTSPLGTCDLKVQDVASLTTLYDGMSYAAVFAPELITNSFYRRIPDLTNRIHFDQVMEDYRVMQVDLSFRDPYLADIFKTGRQADILV
jgi:hypothetical protein